MADKIIVGVFDSVDAARDAATAIKGLHDQGETKFKLESGVIVTKDDRGEVSVVEADHNPFHGTKVGTVIGGLIGLIGGVPLAVAGALLGATAGVINDGGMAVLRGRTVTSITNEMHPGRTAVIIEADEDTPNAIDDIVAKGGGKVFREVL